MAGRIATLTISFGGYGVISRINPPIAEKNPEHNGDRTGIDRGIPARDHVARAT
jgi:hypothetical protein